MRSVVAAAVQVESGQKGEHKSKTQQQGIERKRERERERKNGHSFHVLLGNYRAQVFCHKYRLIKKLKLI